MADKELSAITAAGTLDGTETVHVVQSGNSRRATTGDIAQSGFTVDTYTTADLDTDSDKLVIDISDCNVCEIVVGKLSTSGSSFGQIRLSTDGGTTQETASVYKRIKVDPDASGAAAVQTQVFFGASNSTGDHFGLISLVGHGESSLTKMAVSIGTISSSDAVIRDGLVDTTSVYDALVFTPQDGTSTFDEVDITVFRY